MANGYKIHWSDEANHNLDEIINYLEANWADKEIRSFFTRLDKAVTLISIRPELFRLTNKRKGIRKCVFSKQTSIYYRAEKETITIVSLFANRKRPIY